MGLKYATLNSTKSNWLETILAEKNNSKIKIFKILKSAKIYQ